MLNKAQKFYVDQNRSKMSFEQLALDLEVGLDQIEEYIKSEIDRLQTEKQLSDQKKSVNISIMQPQLSELYDSIRNSKTTSNNNEHITKTKPNK